MANPTSVPRVIRQGEDVVFELPITLFGVEEVDLTGTSARFGLILKPATESRTNALTQSGTIVAGDIDVFKFEISDNDTDSLDIGEYVYNIEYTKATKKYIVKSGVLEVRRGVFSA